MIEKGPEFSSLSEIETWESGQEYYRTGIYFAYFYKSTDWDQNENASGMFRYFFTKEKTMEFRTMEEAIEATDMMKASL